MAARYGVSISDDDDESDEMWFREVEIANTTADLKTLWNVDDYNDEQIQKAGPIFEFQLKQEAE